MDEILSIALRSMQHDMARLDRISMNLANAQTPGYKREVMAVRPFGQMVDGMAAAASATPARGEVLLQIDHRQGTLKNTGQSMDLALGGAGFFEVSTPQGPAYTRQGSFRLDAQGRMVTAQGYPVMGKGGEIVLKNQSPVIDATGQVFDHPAQGTASGRPAGTLPVAQLRVVRFDSGDALEKLGEGLFVSGSPAQALDEMDVQVRQGYVENSNVSSMREMVQMIQATRHFESMQKVAIGYDDMMSTAIRKLGEQG